jgi:hypothetical protein
MSGGKLSMATFPWPAQLAIEFFQESVILGFVVFRIIWVLAQW